MVGNAHKPIKIFYCYAYKDKKLLNELDTHLTTLKREEQVISWYDQEILASREWAQEINKHLKDADIILLFVSPDFIASEYSYGIEMDAALKRHSEESAHVIPIVLRPSDDETAPFSKLRSLPSNGKPVTKWSNRDEAMLNIVQGIRSVVKSIREKYQELDESAKKLTSSKEATELSKNFQPANDVSNISAVDTNLENISHNTTFPLTQRPPLLFDHEQALQVNRKGEPPPLDLATPEETSFEKLKQVVENVDMPTYLEPDTLNEHIYNKENTTQLSLPFDNLETRSKQKSIPSSKKSTGINYDTLYTQAQSSLISNQPNKGLQLLKDLNFEPIPSPQRWRLAGLRGHCYFGLGMFLPAKEDYTYAIKEMPITIPKDQVLEAMDVHLKLAYVQRELGNLPEATEQYHLALAKMDSGAQVRHFAEAYWGLALIELEQASKLSTDLSIQRTRLLHNALVHAKKAKNLYENAEEMLNAVSVSCDIALIEQAAGNIDQASHYLQDIIDTWSPMLVTPPDTVTNQQRLQQYRNVVSAALCYLSSVESDAHFHNEALAHAQRSLEIARQSNALRHAEAAMNLGEILSSQGYYHIKVEKVFREAIDILTPTDFLAARVRAHNMLGHYLISQDRILDGKKELDKAYEVSCKAQGIPL